MATIYCRAAPVIEFRDLQHLLNLNKHRHFGRAASAIGSSQPALTKSLQRLEKQLGAKLFDRPRAQIIPTAVGHEVINHAQSLFSGVAEMTRNFDLMSGLEIGHLVVGAGPAMSDSYATLAIANVAHEHPAIRICVRVNHWRQLTDWLLAGELDLYVGDITEAIIDGRMLCTPLPAEPFV